MPSDKRRHRHRRDSRRRRLMEEDRHTDHQSQSPQPPRDVRGESAENGSEATVSQLLLAGIDRIVDQCRITKSSSVPCSAMTNIINSFNPLTDNIHEWLASVDEYANIYDWDDRMTVYLATSKLRGPAEAWYRGLPSRIFSWSEWKELLISVFQPKRDLHSLLLTMINYVPGPNESLYEYCFSKFSLINKLKLSLSNEDIVNLIMGGITDKQIKFSVETANITCPSRLAAHLKTLVSPSQTVTTNNSGISFENYQHNVNYYKKKGVNRCYSCGEVGHIRDTCQNRKRKASGAHGNHNKQLAIEQRYVNYLGQSSNEKFF